MEETGNRRDPMEETRLEHSIPFVNCQHPHVSPAAWHISFKSVRKKLTSLNQKQRDIFVLDAIFSPLIWNTCARKIISQQALLAYARPPMCLASIDPSKNCETIVLEQHHINLGSNIIGSTSTASRFQSGLLEKNDFVCMEGVLSQMAHIILTDTLYDQNATQNLNIL